MRSRIKKWLLCAGVALVATSCIVDEYEINPELSGEPGTVRFTLAVPGHSTPKPSTRALTEPQEKAIDNVYVLAFYASGDYSGKLAYLKAGEPVTGSSTTFEIELPMGSYDLMVVGNAESEVEGAGLVPRTTTKANAIAALTFSKTGKWDYTKPIPVWGYTLSSVTVSDTTPAAALDIDMHRMVARIDVELSTAAAGTNNANFALTEVYLANYNTVGQIAPNYTNTSVWDDDGGVVNEGSGIALAPSLPEGEGNPTGKQTGMAASAPWAPAQVYNSADGLTAGKVERVIYTFEAENGGKTTHSTNPCLVIGGSYKGDVKTTYYRVDFITKGGTELAPTYDYLDLLRNHRYEITINKVTGAGYDTPKEAFDARSFNMEADVMEWEEADMVESGFDGQYTLAISQNVYEFEAGGGSQPLTIRTDYPGGWKATVYDNENGTGTSARSWLTVTPPSKDMDGTFNVNIAAGANDDAARTAYIHITAGRITLKVTVTQEKYVIPEPNLAAPGVIGYRKSDGQLTLKGSKEYGSNVDIKQFAIDNFGGLEEETVYVAYFKFGSLVAIGSGGGNSDPFDKDDIIAVPKTADNFPYTLVDYKTYVDAGGSTAQNKWDRINDAGDGVTLSDGQNVGTDLTKGLGDPCAYWFDGVYTNNWRLPLGGASDRPNSPVNGWNGGTFGTAKLNSSSSNHGSTWYAIGATGLGYGIPAGRRRSPGWEWYLPAAGYRDDLSDGSVGSQGSHGCYWSSTATGGTDGYRLTFNSGTVYSSLNLNYANGFAVRCVRPE